MKESTWQRISRISHRRGVKAVIAEQKQYITDNFSGGVNKWE